MTYCRERIQIRISQGKNYLGQSLRKYQMWSLHCPHPEESSEYSTFPALMCDNTHRSIANQGNHPNLGLQSF